MFIKQLSFNPITHSAPGRSKPAHCSKCSKGHARRPEPAGVRAASSSNGRRVDRVSSFVFAIAIVAICCKSAFSAEYSSLPLDRAKLFNEHGVVKLFQRILSEDVSEASVAIDARDLTAEMELTYLQEKAHKEDRLLEDVVHDHDHEDDEHHDHEHDDTEVQSSANVAGEKPWGPVLGAAFLVNLASLSGVVLILVPVLYKGVLKLYGAADPSAPLTKGEKIFHIGLPGFAVGALLATAVFLMLPEALHMIGGEHDDGHDGHDHRFLEDAQDDHGDAADHGHDEGATAAKFGCGILVGFLVPMLLGVFFHTTPVVNENASIDAQAKEVSHCESCADDRIEDADDISDAHENISSAIAIDVEDPKTVQINWSVAGSVLVGDMFHNFGDGLFIGAAFLGCSWATAWSITAATIYHEMAQEVSDFIVLTHVAGLSNTKAFVLNFISGLSVVLGGIVILAAEPTDEAVGVVLAIAAGVYFYIAACETVPRIEVAVKDRMDRVLAIFAIMLGTIPLGLVLLDHKHCG